jgi:hypothetical protein
MSTVTVERTTSPADPSVWVGRNVSLLKLFGPVLIVVGVLGFVLPPAVALTSGAAPYNVFHIAFGLLGTALAFKSAPRHAAVFNVAFGAIDLYQAAASFAHLPPAALFAYKPADDVLHVVIGAALVGAGLLGLRSTART